jgi:hypothetical protein
MPSGRYAVPSASFQQGSSGDQWFVGKNNISDKLLSTSSKSSASILYTQIVISKACDLPGHII